MKTLMMVIFSAFFLALSSLYTVSAMAAQATDNAELQRLFEADQEARRSQRTDWDVMDQEDAERREAVLELFRAGKITTGTDYFNAAVIFQHGENVEDIRVAHSFATMSAQLGFSRAYWLKAASWDRLMMYFGQPQWYGTQFTMNDDGQWILYQVAAGVISDDQRAEWSLPSLAEAKARAEARN